MNDADQRKRTLFSGVAAKSFGLRLTLQFKEGRQRFGLSRKKMLPRFVCAVARIAGSFDFSSVMSKVERILRDHVLH